MRAGQAFREEQQMVEGTLGSELLSVAAAVSRELEFDILHELPTKGVDPKCFACHEFYPSAELLERMRRASTSRSNRLANLRTYCSTTNKQARTSGERSCSGTGRLSFPIHRATIASF